MNFWKKSATRVHSEDWFTQLYRQLPADDSRAYTRCDEPDDAFLRRLASSLRKPSPLDPRVSHVAHCSRCLQRLMELRQSSSGSQSGERTLVAWGIALAIVVLCGIGLVWHFADRPTPAQMATAPSLPPVSQTIDLSTSASTRGIPAQVPFASIPRRTVKLTLILPALSQPGPYSVAISNTRPAMQTAAAATGMAFEQGRQTRLKVTLRMGMVEPGMYYLSTTDRENGVVYYYPLKVVPSP